MLVSSIRCPTCNLTHLKPLPFFPFSKICTRKHAQKLITEVIGGFRSLRGSRYQNLWWDGRILDGTEVGCERIVGEVVSELFFLLWMIRLGWIGRQDARVELSHVIECPRNIFCKTFLTVPFSMAFFAAVGMNITFFSAGSLDSNFACASLFCSFCWLLVFLNFLATSSRFILFLIDEGSNRLAVIEEGKWVFPITDVTSFESLPSKWSPCPLRMSNTEQKNIGSCIRLYWFQNVWYR